MKTKLLRSENNIVLKPTEDIQFVLVPENKVDVEIIFEKPGVNVELIVLYILHNDESVVLSTLSKHTVPNTSCEVKVGCVLYDFSKSDYLGRIQVLKNAQESKSTLSDKAVTMGDFVKNSSNPILEIEANNVTVSHGATTGGIQEDQLFYLMSRGFTKPEAEKLLVKAFLSDLLNNINDEKIKKEVEEKLYD